MAEGKLQSVGDDTFEAEVLQSKGITVIDFWAEWCGPCLQMAPVLESFAETNTGKVKVLKMDIDSNPNTPQRFGIRSIPTLIYFKDGQQASSLIGYQAESVLQDQLDKLLEG